MKTIQIILLILIIIGVALLCTQKFWVTPLVSAILKYQDAGEVEETSEIVQPTQDGMESWNWVLSEISPQGTQFSYPNPLPTKYVTAVDWPPFITMSAGELECSNEELVTPDGLKKRLESRLIGDTLYCVGVSSEGAAGSTYTTYEYMTAEGDFVMQAIFTLRTPQCLNYDEPEQSVCMKEQAGLNIDALADRIVSSIRMQ